MRLRLLGAWNKARSSYWFIPGIMLFGAVVVALALISVDRRLAATAGWAFAGGVDGARAVLQVIAGSMITVAGTVFSITIVALSLTSQQYGPRLLGRFMRDPGSQVVLGTFVSTFAYSLVTLRSVRAAGQHDEFVPYVSVAFALALALAGVMVLIYFIHHTAASLRVDNLVAALGRELEREVERNFSEPVGRGSLAEERELREGADLPDDFDENSSVVPATNSGYVVEIDLDGLASIAQERDAVLWLQQRRGGFLAAHAPLARVYPPDASDDDLIEQVNGRIVLGVRRSGPDDVDFLIGQLVEMALRALSPSLNDPFTATACLDQLGRGLADLAGIASPSAYHYEDGALRLITEEMTFEELVDLAFDQIRQSSREHPVVMMHMLEVIAFVGSETETQGRRAHLLEHARMIRRQAQESVFEEHDLLEIEERYEAVARALGGEETTLETE